MPQSGVSISRVSAIAGSQPTCRTCHGLGLAAGLPARNRSTPSGPLRSAFSHSAGSKAISGPEGGSGAGTSRTVGRRHRRHTDRRPVEAASELDIDVVATVGGQADASALGAIPGNTRVERYVPQSFLIKRASLVVSHAGAGTIIAAASAGKPHRSISLSADNWDNADFLARHNVGITSSRTSAMPRPSDGPSPARPPGNAVRCIDDQRPLPRDAPPPRSRHDTGTTDLSPVATRFRLCRLAPSAYATDVVLCRSVGRHRAFDQEQVARRATVRDSREYFSDGQRAPATGASRLTWTRS